MLLKITGMIILITSGTLLGFSLCNDYMERILCLEAIKKALIILKGEIKHNNSSICEALDNIKVNNNQVMSFLQKVVMKYRNKKFSLWEAWNESVLESFNKTIKLSKEEIDIIRDFGRNLGITDRETQMKNIDECISEMNRCLMELKNEKKEKCKLYKVLGVLSGLFISIMLL